MKTLRTGGGTSEAGVGYGSSVLTRDYPKLLLPPSGPGVLYCFFYSEPRDLRTPGTVVKSNPCFYLTNEDADIFVGVPRDLLRKKCTDMDYLTTSLLVVK